MSEIEEKSYRLRIPVDLYAELEQMADEEDRSVNAQIIRILRESVRRWKAAKQSGSNKGYTEDIETSELEEVVA